MNSPARFVVLAVLWLCAATAGPEWGQPPDLTCTIWASESDQFPNLIGNGTSLSYGGGAPKIWFGIRMDNKGQGKVDKTFRVNILIKNNGATLFNKGYDVPAPLDPGKWKFRPLDPERIVINLPAVTNKIDAIGDVDPLPAIAESNESNNQCTLHFTVTVAG